MNNSILICGNKYDADSTLEELIKKCGIDNITKINDPSSVDSIVSDICQPDLFASQRVIIINQIPKNMVTEIAPFLSRIPPNNLVAFVSYESLKSKKKFVNFFKENDSFYEFDYVISNPSSIVKKLLEKEGKKADSAVIDHLISTVGSDISLLISEIKKLCNHSGTRKSIKKEDIDDICCPNYEFVIWDFLNNVSSSKDKDISSVCHSLSAARQSGCDYEFLLAMLLRSIKLALMLREGVARKMPETKMREGIQKIKKSDSDSPVYGDYEIRKVMQSPTSFYNKYKLFELYICLRRCYETIVSLRKIYDEEDRTREMTVCVFGICHPSWCVMKYERGDIYD